MKLLVGIVLVLLSPQIYTAESTEPKSAPLLKFIRSTILEGMSQKLIDDSLHMAELFKISASFLHSHRADPNFDQMEYDALQKYVENLQNYATRLSADKTNCYAFQQLANYFGHIKHEKRNRFAKLEALSKNHQGDIPKQDIDKQYRQYDEENMKHVSQTWETLFEQLPSRINNFMASVEDNEKEQYAILLSWCQKYLAAPKLELKYNLILEFLNEFIVEQKYAGRARFQNVSNLCSSGLALYRHFQYIEPNFE
ncbi:uncharacterized protein [Musca autumnalis]|uniref:uncharacterized protein n=1 Tax=Musca autumnalis TaxID=221902 RepID=UPI003CF48932